MSLVYFLFNNMLNEDDRLGEPDSPKRSLPNQVPSRRRNARPDAETDFVGEVTSSSNQSKVYRRSQIPKRADSDADFGITNSEFANLNDAAERLPSLIPPDETRRQNFDEDATFTTSDEIDRQRVMEVQAAKLNNLDEQIREAISRAELRLREDHNAEMKMMVAKLSTYEDQLRLAVAARQKWKEQRKEFALALNDLKFKFDEAKERAEVSAYQSNKLGGVILIGGGPKKNYDDAGARVADTLLLPDVVDGAVVEYDDADDSTAKLGLKSFYLLTIGKINRFILSALRVFNIFASDVKRISDRYGGPIVPYFTFVNSTVILSMITLLGNAPLLILQGAFKSTSSHECGVFSGVCWTLYGAFPVSSNLYYFVTIGGSAVVTFLFTVTLWTRFDRKFQRSQLLSELSDRRRFSPIVLAAWDFRQSDDNAKATLSTRLANNLEALKLESERTEYLRNLSRAQSQWRFYKRIICYLINAIVIITGWVVVVLVNRYTQAISDSVSSLGSGTFVTLTAEYFPALTLSVVNILVPQVVYMVTQYEDWAPAVQDQELTRRLYLARMLNILIYVAVYYELIGGTALFGESYGTLITRSDSYTCSADQAAVGILSLSVVDVILNLLGDVVYTPLIPYIISWATDSVRVRPPFDTAGNVVRHTITMSLAWLSMVLTPFAAIWFIIAMIVSYLGMRVQLMYSETQASNATEVLAVGLLISRLLCITSIIYLAFCALMLLFPLNCPTGCGPFLPGQRALDTLGVSILSYYGYTGIIFTAVAVGFLMIVIFRNIKISALRRALEGAIERSGRILSKLQRDLKRATIQSETLKNRIDRQRRRASIEL